MVFSEMPRSASFAQSRSLTSNAIVVAPFQRECTESQAEAAQTLALALPARQGDAEPRCAYSER